MDFPIIHMGYGWCRIEYVNMFNTSYLVVECIIAWPTIIRLYMLPNHGKK